jgi:xylose isomerase
MAFIGKVQPYAIITLDLSTAHNLTPVGSITTNTGQALTAWIANQLLVNTVTTGAAFSIGVQDGTVAGGMMTGAAGLKLIGIPFNDIIYTNTPQGGGTTAQIIVACTAPNSSSAPVAAVSVT